MGAAPRTFEDPQVRVSGAFIEVPAPEGDPVPGVGLPVHFSGTPWAPSGPTPECGQHTEEVLLELGLDWEAIGTLKDRGVLG